jgi:hypothetical protein
MEEAWPEAINAGQHKSWVGNEILKWHLIFLGCFMSSFWDLKFWGDCWFFGKFLHLSVNEYGDSQTSRTE